MRILIAGWHGQIARALVEAGTAMPEIAALAVGRPALDLCKPSSVRNAMADANPDVMINTAAYTEVDRAEEEPETAFRLNCEGAAVFAELAAKRRRPVIHLSTEYVFNGAKMDPYNEDDAPDPQSVYGRSKLAGEQAVAAANPHHVILRTTWIYSAHGDNFVKNMLARAREESRIEVVDDQQGCPTNAAHLAAAILTIAMSLTQGEAGGRWGIYHACGSGSTSWFGFAKALFEKSAELGGPTAQVSPTTGAAYPALAPRLANGRLDCAKLKDTFGIRLPHYAPGLEDCLREILAP